MNQKQVKNVNDWVKNNEKINLLIFYKIFYKMMQFYITNVIVYSNMARYGLNAFMY